MSATNTKGDQERRTVTLLGKRSNRPGSPRRQRNSLSKHTCQINTVCPRSLDPFNKVTYCTKMDKIPWTFSRRHSLTRFKHYLFNNSF